MEKKNTVLSAEGNKFTLSHEESMELSLEGMLSDIESLKKNISVAEGDIVRYGDDIKLLEKIVADARSMGAKTQAEIDAEKVEVVTAEVVSTAETAETVSA
jgi:hypothetical protein